MPQKLVLAAAIVLGALAHGTAACAAEPHARAWWQAVIADDFTLPPGTALEPAVRELSGFLGSPDPELRDDIAYAVLTQWLYVQRIVPSELRDELIDAWLANLSRNIGEEGTDSVFLRSFSALMLSVAAALDNQAPYLDDREFERLLEAALRYLADERDTRGFEDGKGWMHSVAHTADWLKFLGRSGRLDPEDQGAVLGAISEKLAWVDHPLAFGEDERLAQAVLSIIARPDADPAAIGAFVNALRRVPIEGAPTRAALVANQNRRHLALALHALLVTDGRDLPVLRQAEAQVRALLENRL